MMRDKRLLERLLEAEQRDELRAGRRTEERLLSSVVHHLQRLLNTRRGNAAIDPEYGVPDLSRLVGGATAPDGARVEQLVRQVIERYEPRVRQVAVRFAGLTADGLGLRLEIEAAIEHAGSRLPLRLRPTVLPDGRFEFNAKGTE
jgi:type VI secretion system protein